MNYRRHARAHILQISTIHRHSPYLKHLEVITVACLCSLPDSKVTYILDTGDAHAYGLVKSRDIGILLRTDGDARQEVLAHVERQRQLARHCHVHYRRTTAHQFTQLREDLGDFSISHGSKHSLVDIRRHLRNSTLGLLHLGIGSLLVLISYAILCHFILRLGSLLCCHHCLILCLGLIVLLCRHHTFLKKVGNALVALLCHIQTSLGLLPHLVCTGNLLLLGTIAGLLVECLGSLIQSRSLIELGRHVRSLKDDERIALAHHIALTYANLQHTTRHLARNAVVGSLHLTLNEFGTVRQTKADNNQNNNRYDNDSSKHGCCSSSFLIHSSII